VQGLSRYVDRLVPEVAPDQWLQAGHHGGTVRGITLRAASSASTNSAKRGTHMSKRPKRQASAVLVALALLGTACGGGGGGDGDSKSKDTTPSSGSVAVGTGTGERKVNPLFVATDSSGKSTGGTNPVTVRIRESSDQKLRVGFTEDEVAGTGDQWRAAGWGAVTVATLITGAPLRNREVDFDVTGKIDGPSAGALMTVATLSLMRGDELQPDITMTGTISPDGTVGPVGGIPYKVDGAVEAGKKRMLIPPGQRNSPDDSGERVDVVEIGRRKGVEVAEVRDIYEVYKAFTGKDLPRSPEASDVKLDEATYQKLRAKTETWLAKYDRADNEFATLSSAIRNDSVIQSIASSAVDAHDQAQKLTDGGLQAGAFNKALQAYALANAAVTVGESLQVLLTQGVDEFVSQIKASATISDRVDALVDELKTFQPQSLSDAAALVAAYGNAVDAVTLSVFGQNQLDAEAATRSEAIAQAEIGALYYEFAGTLVESARDVLDVGRGLGGAPLGPDIDTGDVSEFFRKAGEANLVAFESLIVEPKAEQANVSVATAKVNFAANDSNYAAAQSGVNVIGSIEKYFADPGASAYAKLGGSVTLYARTAGLLAKYYSLGETDESLNVTDIRNQEAFNASISLAQSQLAGGVGVLRSKQVNPVIAVASAEVAGVDREGSASDKLDALNEYWSGYLNSRVLAYLGGFPQI
jgi:uncharacterized protein